MTNDGHRLAANQSLLRLHSTKLSALIGQLGCNEVPNISVDAPATNVSALLNFITDGETKFKNEEMFEEVKLLAKSMGMNIFCNETSLLLFEDEDENNEHSFEMEEYEMEKSQMEFLMEFQMEELDNVQRPNQVQNIKGKSNESSKNIKKENIIFDCNLCPKVFKSKNKLKFHTMCHTSYNCIHCQKGFRFTSLLKRHMSVYHEENITKKLLMDTEFSRNHVNNILFSKGFLSQESLKV